MEKVNYCRSESDSSRLTQLNITVDWIIGMAIGVGILGDKGTLPHQSINYTSYLFNIVSLTSLLEGPTVSALEEIMACLQLERDSILCCSSINFCFVYCLMEVELFCVFQIYS